MPITSRMCQKAPSAIRCIKTSPYRAASAFAVSGQKAPSAIRCIKTGLGDRLPGAAGASEST